MAGKNKPPQRNLWVKFDLKHGLPPADTGGYGRSGSAGIPYRNCRRVRKDLESRRNQACSGNFFFSRAFVPKKDPQIPLKTQK